MSKAKRDYLKRLLKDIPKAYTELTQCLPVLAESYGCLDEIIAFVEAGDGVDAGTVAQKLVDIAGLEPLTIVD